MQQEKQLNRHGELIPDSIEAVFYGSSNCEKSNSILTLIIYPNG